MLWIKYPNLKSEHHSIAVRMIFGYHREPLQPLNLYFPDELQLLAYTTVVVHIGILKNEGQPYRADTIKKSPKITKLR